MKDEEKAIASGLGAIVSGITTKVSHDLTLALYSIYTGMRYTNDVYNTPHNTSKLLGDIFAATSTMETVTYIAGAATVLLEIWTIYYGTKFIDKYIEKL